MPHDNFPINTLMKTNSKTESGNIVVVTVITLALVSVFVGLAVEYTNNVGRNVQRSILLRQATNIADASTEMSFSAWRAIARQKGSTVMKMQDMNNELPTPTPGNFPGVSRGYTLSNYFVYPLDYRGNPKTQYDDKPDKIKGSNANDISYYFLASADVVVPTISSKNPTSTSDRNNIVAKVRRVFQKETLSLWRYAIFFDDDLEMHPGATQVVNGEVHTNKSLYTAHNLLTLNGKTTYTNLWDKNFKPGDSRRGVETPTFPLYSIPPANAQAQKPYDTVMPDYHELIESTKVPKVPALDPALASNRFETQAAVSITIDASDNIRIYKNGGAEITNAFDSGPRSNGRLAQTFKNAITLNGSITDVREGATTGNGTVGLATLDVGAITTAINNNSINLNPAPIVYIIDTSATKGRNADGTINSSQVKAGIRLKNGASLPAGGLTIASGNPVYVQGDYNTGTTYNADGTISTQPLSNASTPDPTQPTVPGYTRQPAAIIADAVNVLSNAWQGAGGAAASPTTVNSAFISGNVETANGNYSGGVENFPRLHENWTGKALTYYGSMIQLYQSKQAIGRWGPGYNAPKRPWYFDTNFLTDPPPGSLVAINYRRSRWYML